MTRLDGERWRKSTRSTDSGTCVELHPVGAVRDSKFPSGPVLAFGDYEAVRRLADAVR